MTMSCDIEMLTSSIAVKRAKLTSDCYTLKVNPRPSGRTIFCSRVIFSVKWCHLGNSIPSRMLAMSYYVFVYILINVHFVQCCLQIS